MDLNCSFIISHALQSQPTNDIIITHQKNNMTTTDHNHVLKKKKKKEKKKTHDSMARGERMLNF
jgi:hypothetical protein